MRGTASWCWRAWHGLPVVVQDAVLAVVLAAAAFVPPLRGSGVVLGELPARPEDSLAVLLALGQALPLVLRRRAPAVCLVVVGACFAAYQVRGYASFYTGTGMIIALYSAGAHERQARTFLATSFTATYAVLVLVLHALGSAETSATDLTFYLLFAACWGAGRWRRARIAEEAEGQRLVTVQAAAAERARIARELHDVVTHHVTTMVVLADSGVFLGDQPARVGKTLGDIAASGRQALVELREQLGVLQPLTDSGPAGALVPPERLSDLVERARTSGQPVRLLQHGQLDDLTGAVGLAVHRVVQESLTNAIKHAPSCPTTVRLNRDDTAVDVEVTTSGPATARAAAPRPVPAGAGAGLGLTGLEERVAVLGGRLEAGPWADGGFRVQARIPVHPS